MIIYAGQLNAYLNMKASLCLPQEECFKAKEQPLRMVMVQLVKKV